MLSCWSCAIIAGMVIEKWGTDIGVCGEGRRTIIELPNKAASSDPVDFTLRFGPVSAADSDRGETFLLRERDIAFLGQFEAGAEGRGPGR